MISRLDMKKTFRIFQFSIPSARFCLSSDLGGCLILHKNSWRGSVTAWRLESLHWLLPLSRVGECVSLSFLIFAWQVITRAFSASRSVMRCYSCPDNTDATLQLIGIMSYLTIKSYNQIKKFRFMS